MTIAGIVKSVLDEKGLLQRWVVDAMNQIDPTVHMSNAKLSAITCGRRRMTGDELLAFCKATETNPDVFLERTQSKRKKDKFVQI